MSNPAEQLDKLLQLVEEHIDLEHCRQVDERYRRAFSGESVDHPPLVVQAEWGDCWRLPEPWDRFEHYRHRDAFHDPIKMMQNQLLERVVPGLILRDDSPLSIRNNHGTIQIATILGGKWNMYDDNPPWIESWGSNEAVAELVSRTEPIDLRGGVVERSIATLQLYGERLERYPKCRLAIQISMPDLQGPFDTAEQLWGRHIFLGLHDEPQLATALLEKVADTMLQVEPVYRAYARDRLEPQANSQHGYNIPGRLMIRDDSSILVSPKDYRQMIMPHNARILQSVGGGSLHFCGNGEHLIESLLTIPDLKGLDFGQSNMMDIERIYDVCRSRGVSITNHTPTRQQLIDGSARRRFPTGIVMTYLTQNLGEAAEVVAAYQRTETVSA